MTLSRRALLTGAAALGTTASLAGCGKSGADPLEGASTALPTGPVTLSWWAASIAGRDGGDMRLPLIHAFERRHPNIRINLIKAPQSTDQNRATLVAQIAGGSPSPDVYMGDIVWPEQFAHNSLALPLDTLVPADFWQHYPGELIRASSAGGKVYAFPLYLDEAFLYYREDLLDKHGFRVPRSWEELARTAGKIRESGDIDYGFVWQGSVYEGLTVNFSEFLEDAGGAVLSPDGNSVTVARPPGDRALSFMRKLVSSGVSPSAVTTYIEQSSMDAFSSGRSLFLRNWAYAWGAANTPDTSKVAGKVGVVPRPGFEGEKTRHVSGLGGWSNYLNPHTENLGAALAFARFCAEEEAQLRLVREGAVLPAHSEALNSRAAEKVGNPVLLRAGDVHLVSRPTATPYYPKVSKAVYTQASSAISGSKPVDAALSAMRSGVERAIEGVAL